MGEQTGASSPLLWSCRLQITLAISLGLLLHYMLRYNLSVAIVCMLLSPDVNVTLLNDTFYNTTVVGEGDCISDGTIAAVDYGYKGEFNWDRQMVGNILASYFYSYVCVQLLSGWLASQFGGKHVFGGGMLLAGVATLLVPVCARTHVSLVFFMRIIMGIGTGVTFPTTHALMGCWVPPNERSRLMGIAFAGAIFGSVIAMVVAGQLCAVSYDNGWPLIFYLFGGLTIIWWLFWMYVVHSTPEMHPRISQKEKAYIQTGLCRTNSKQTMRVKVPWYSIITSKAVWATTIAHITSGYGIYTVLTVIPLYMQDVLQYNIKDNGFLSALPSILSVIMSIFNGFLSDLLITKHILTTTQTRKMMQGIAQVGPIIFMISLSYMGCEQRSLAVVFLCLAVVCFSGARVGYQINHADIAPRYAGVVYGFSNTLANMTGFIVPIVTAALTPNGTRAEWQRVFFICSGSYAIGFIAFMTWGSGEEQDWAKVFKLKKERTKVLETEGKIKEEEQVEPLKVTV